MVYEQNECKIEDRQVAAMRQIHLAFPLLDNFQSEIGKSSTVAVEASARLPMPCSTARNGAGNKNQASVCGRRAETVERRRRDDMERRRSA